MHHGEKILASKALFDQSLLGRDRHRISALNKQRFNGPTAAQGIVVARQHAPDLRLVELADGFVKSVEAFNQRFAPMIDRTIVMERATTLILPGTCRRSNTARRMHVDGSVTLA